MKSARDFEAERKADEKILTSEPRKLWRNLEDYKSISSAETLKTVEAKRAQEFSSEIPVDEKVDGQGAQKTEPKILEDVSRRRFLQFMGATGVAMSTAACKRRPVDHLVPYVHKPQGYVYGVPVWYASSTPEGLGVLIKTREGRPIKLEGNPDHPINEGGLDSQTQASLFHLYNPERLKGAYDGAKKTLTWQESDTQILEALKSARSGAVRILTGNIFSPSLREVIKEFADVYKSKHHSFTISEDEMVARAAERLMGEEILPTWRFEKADVVVSIDADFLGTWGNQVLNGKTFSSRRQTHRGQTNQNRLFVFESRFSTTGAAADHRTPIAPSQQLAILRALTTLVDGGTVEVSGVDSKILREAASALAKARGSSLVVASGTGPQALEVQLAAFALNRALGNIGTTVDFDLPMFTGRENTESFESLVKDLQSGVVDVLIIHGVNPVYTASFVKFGDLISKAKTVVTITSEWNETALRSNFVLGESHFIETWGDSEVRAGIVAIQQPVIEPLYETRSFGENLNFWAKPEAKTEYREIVQAHWKKNFAASGNFETWWMEQLKIGATKHSGGRKTAGKSAGFKWTAANDAISAASKISSGDMEVVFYPSLAILDGSFASNPYLQELPDPITKTTWSNFIAVSPATGKKLGIDPKDITNMANTKEPVTALKMGDQTLTLPTFVQPGMKDNVVAVAIGYGRTEAGTIGTNVGKNVFPFAVWKNGRVQLSGMKAEISRTGEFATLAGTQKHFDLQGRDRDILQHATLAEFLKDPKTAKGSEEHEKKLSMYSENEFVYPDHKWGMAIDLNACTGCQACIVGCYTENNVPIVGEKEVVMGRHMAWLRMDLYYGGEPEAPEATFEPMLCQQCDNAPCETVCPVLATVHTTDGLNAMTYNRCVGTRYCSNNCPYKVRRFNYFQYSDAYARKLDVADPLPMMLNPDVTVRTRGVMEKCTFCAQRLMRAKDEFKDKGTKVPDGAVKTACQQSCPAGAISFGDLNDPQSEVSKMAAKAQAFKVLEVLNTRPNISYLPRLRNKGAAES